MYYNLCISGGGIKLISSLGVLKYLFENKYISYNLLQKISGVSAGAMISFMITIGYTINEIEDFACNFNFKKLLPETNTENLLFYYGFDTNNKLSHMLSLLLKNKYNITDITFKELFDKNKKTLQIGVSNITDNKFELWDYTNNPNTSIIQAVAISACVPIVYKPFDINNKFYIDGGIINNFPINLFDDYELKFTIGIACDFDVEYEFSNVFEYLGKIINTISTNNDIDKINKYKNIVDIIAIKGDGDFLPNNITEKDIKNKINIGFDIAKHFYINKKYKKIRRHSI